MNQNITVDQWKEVKGYEGIYQISSNGVVKRLQRRVVCGHGGLQVRPEKIINLQVSKKGYYMVCLYKNSKQESTTIHKLVANHFVPNNQNEKTIDHIDGNKKNNDYRNLEWVSNSENRRRAVKNKLHAFGERAGSSKLSQKDVEYIRREFMLNSNTTGDKTTIYNKLASGYGLFRGTVKEICQGKRWSHLPTYVK